MFFFWNDDWECRYVFFGTLFIEKAHMFFLEHGYVFQTTETVCFSEFQFYFKNTKIIRL